MAMTLCIKVLGIHGNSHTLIIWGPAVVALCKELESCLRSHNSPPTVDLKIPQIPPKVRLGRIMHDVRVWCLEL